MMFVRLLVELDCSLHESVQRSGGCDDGLAGGDSMTPGFPKAYKEPKSSYSAAFIGPTQFRCELRADPCGT